MGDLTKKWKSKFCVLKQEQTYIFRKKIIQKKLFSENQLKSHIPAHTYSDHIEKMCQKVLRLNHHNRITGLEECKNLGANHSLLLLEELYPNNNGTGVEFDNDFGKCD